MLVVNQIALPYWVIQYIIMSFSEMWDVFDHHNVRIWFGVNMGTSWFVFNFAISHIAVNDNAF